MSIFYFSSFKVSFSDFFLVEEKISTEFKMKQRQNLSYYCCTLIKNSCYYLPWYCRTFQLTI